MKLPSRTLRAALAPALVVALVTACAGGGDRPSDQPVSADPVIDTQSLEVMTQGLPVQVQLRARVAAEPASWSFDEELPPSVSWLSLTTDGLLSGTPPSVLRPAVQVAVRVTDAARHTKTVRLPVEVHGCDPGAHPRGEECFAPSAHGCTQGRTFCTDGAFEPCSGGASVDPLHCGSICAPCAENTADRCAGGTTCQCGQGAACTGAHTTAFSCTAGACANTCEPLFGDCDADPVNGCETSVTSTTHCGACNVACDAKPNATPTCPLGSCTQTCTGGWGNCDGDMASNGCEAQLNTATNCGACSSPCNPAANTTASCATGSCVRTCSGGWGDCDGGMDSNGCETQLNTATNCGACGTPCGAIANGTATCATGSCVRTCTAGWRDCDGNLVANGCETQTSGSDVNNCGGCNARCTAPVNGSVSCQAGGCVPACPANSANAGGTCTCGSGRGNCDGSWANGCETQTNGSDVNNCGGCNLRCTAPVNGSVSCQAGGCVPACPANSANAGGTCTCGSGWGNCDGSWANGCELQTNGSDVNNCGGCNLRCTAPVNGSVSCQAGGCVPACPAHSTNAGGTCTCGAGWANCDGSWANGCETQTNGSDVNNCGGCNVRCTAPAGGGASCQAGSCSQTCPANSYISGGSCVCSPGWGNCDGNLGNGCETQTNGSDLNNCGGCNVGCTAPAGGGASCQAGSCSQTCPANSTNTGGTCTCSSGWQSCNGTMSDGCETFVAGSDLANCGGCNVRCTAPGNGGSASCQSGGCARSCPSGMTIDANGNCACVAGYSPCGSGCANLSSDLNNCGACGRVCPSDDLGNRTRTCTSGVCGLRCPTGTKWCADIEACIPSAERCIIDPCFVAGTPVTMADGSLRAIEDVAAGDVVLAMDPDTGELSAATVDRPLVHPDTAALVRINGRITTTPEHRFFVRGAWVHARDLRPGDVLLAAARDLFGFSTGEEIVTSLESLEGGVTTYNLEVQTLHDYFAGGVLVHNAKN